MRGHQPACPTGEWCRLPRRWPAGPPMTRPVPGPCRYVQSARAHTLTVADVPQDDRTVVVSGGQDAWRGLGGIACPQQGTRFGDRAIGDGDLTMRARATARPPRLSNPLSRAVKSTAVQQNPVLTRSQHHAVRRVRTSRSADSLSARGLCVSVTRSRPCRTPSSAATTSSAEPVHARSVTAAPPDREIQAPVYGPRPDSTTVHHLTPLVRVPFGPCATAITVRPHLRGAEWRQRSGGRPRPIRPDGPPATGMRAPARPRQGHNRVPGRRRERPADRLGNTTQHRPGAPRAVFPTYTVPAMAVTALESGARAVPRCRCNRVPSTTARSPPGPATAAFPAASPSTQGWFAMRAGRRQPNTGQEDADVDPCAPGWQLEGRVRSTGRRVGRSGLRP